MYTRCDMKKFSTSPAKLAVPRSIFVFIRYYRVNQFI